MKGSYSTVNKRHYILELGHSSHKMSYSASSYGPLRPYQFQLFHAASDSAVALRSQSADPSVKVFPKKLKAKLAPQLLFPVPSSCCLWNSQLQCELFSIWSEWKAPWLKLGGHRNNTARTSGWVQGAAAAWSYARLNLAYNHSSGVPTGNWFCNKTLSGIRMPTNSRKLNSHQLKTIERSKY